MKRVKVQFLRIKCIVFGLIVVQSHTIVARQFNSSIENKTKNVLFFDTKTNYSIAVETNASESEKWAAQELQHWLQEISQAYFPILEYSEKQFESWSKMGPKIYVGFSEALKSVIKNSEPEYNDESFRYFNIDSDIYIYGGKLRGTMYGVMSFLENEFGCRWYTPVVKIIPPKKDYVFYSFDHIESPGIKVRNDFYYLAFDPVWAARNKMNGRHSFGTPVKVQPGGVESYWRVHTFYYFMPPEEFFDNHPEYYSLKNGKRIANHDESWSERGQLCLSNPAVLRIVTERVMKQMREDPKHMIYSVSQNDWLNPCQCDKCQAIVNSYGGEESGIIIWFVNKVAEAVEKEFPDKYIGTLAYQYARSAPKGIKPRNNVVIRLCPIEACVAHPLETCPNNESFMTDLKNWSAISPQLFIWDYVVNFSRYIMPYPNFKVLQPNIKTFQKNKAIGIMEQGAYQNHGGEFSELKSYLIAKLLWNPDCDVDAVIDDFMAGYYGRSGKFIREYLDLLQNQITPETHMKIGLESDDPVFSDNLIKKSIEILKNAQKASDNNIISRRVEVATLPILYLKCKRSPVIARTDGTFEKFLEILKKEGVTTLAEYGEDMHLDLLKDFVLNAK